MKIEEVLKCLNSQLNQWNDGIPEPLLDDAGLTGEFLKIALDILAKPEYKEAADEVNKEFAKLFPNKAE